MFRPSWSPPFHPQYPSDSCPPIATERLAITDGGWIRHTLRTPYRDGASHVIFEPMDFMARLAASPGPGGRQRI
jgi:hypothetical protein